MDPDGLAENGGATGKPAGERYRFDRIRVDAVAHVLSRDGVPQAVEPKAFAVLLVLLRHAGELVTHEQLLDAVWGHRHVTPGVLTRAIAQLRAALDDHPHAPRYIQTRHALGYRFIGELEPLAAPVSPPAAEPAAVPAGDGGGGTPPAEPAPASPTPRPAPDQPAQRVQPVQPSPPTPSTPPAAARDPPAAVAPLPPGPEAAPALPVPAGAGRASQRSRRHLRTAVAGLAALLVLSLAALVWSNRDGLAPRHPAAASIAVLPFTSLSSEQDDGYFAEGLSIEMQGALAGVPGLQVAARSSAEAAARRGLDVRKLGRMLGVATVLDASVRRDGRRVRIDARLSDTASGYVLWSQSYDRELADVFAVQTEIAGEVVRALLGVLPQAPALGARLAPTDDVAAYEAYLKGLQQLQASGDDAQLQQAIGFFGEALAADAGFARAQAGICRAELMRFENARDAPAFERAQAACRRAARMDPQLREVSLALGELHRVRGEPAQAAAHYRRALDDIALRPAALIGLARNEDAQGHGERALQYLQRAQVLRPNDATVHRELGMHHYLNGKLDAAIAAFRTATLLLPDDAELWAGLGGLHLAAGEQDAAARAFRRSLAIVPTYGALSNFGSLRYEQGAYAEAAGLYRRATELDAGDFRLWGNLADAIAASGDAAQAREPYRRAAEMATEYVRVRDGDPQALALLAWYRANLGETEVAAQRLRQTEALADGSGEVAFFNAQTLALLGDAEGARRWLAQAREAGVPAQRIRASPLLRRLAGAGGEGTGHGGVRQR